MQENKKSTGPIVAFAVGLSLIGSLALVQFTPLIPDAFAQQTGTQSSSSGSTSPYVPKLSFQPQNGIPLGPPYGNPTATQQAELVAIGVVLGAFATGIATAIYLARGKTRTFMRIR